ncbi:MAG: OFA family MFS transporter [Candidatus Hydrogenedentota bacterium]
MTNITDSATQPNRVQYPIFGTLMMLCIGNVYAWSVFRKPLEAAYGWTAAEATMPFQISIAVFALAMIFAGRWQDRSGPKPVAMTGGILIGLGFILSGIFGGTLTGLCIAFGIVAGIGMGGAYVTPLATTIKWWADKRGLMTGLVVMGMGAGSIIGGIGGPILIDKVGILNTFIIFGAAFGTIITICGAFLKNPPKGYRTPGWTPPKVEDESRRIVRHQFSPKEMMKTLPFYLLWGSFVIGSGVGLMVISQVSPIGQEMAGLTPLVAGGAVTILAIFNGLGRPAFGAISDRIGRKSAVLLAFAIEIAALMIVLPNADNFTIYAIGVSLIGFSYGGFLSLMPAITADFFGSKNIGNNYAWVYSAWGAAGVLGPIVGVQVRAATGAWLNAFSILAAACVLGMIFTALTKSPQPIEATQTQPTLAPKPARI